MQYAVSELEKNEFQKLPNLWKITLKSDLIVTMQNCSVEKDKEPLDKGTLVLLFEIII